MSNGEETKVEVPQEEKAFTDLLKKFAIGTKALAAETIAENISRTGGERVFEEPVGLAERLSTWHEYISPVKRKQILEQWFAEKEIEVPAEATRVAGVKTADIRKREEEQEKRRQDEEKRKTKFFVEPDTGVIRSAKEGETPLTWDEAERVADRMKKEKGKGGKEGEDEEAQRREAEEKRKTKFFVETDTGVIRSAKEGETPLTWDEAERVADRMKKEHGKGGKEGEDDEAQRREAEEKRKTKFFVEPDTGVIRAAKEGEIPLTMVEAETISDRIKKEKDKGDKDEKEAPFIADSEGNWQLNPKAKIGGMELLAFESVRRSQERGEPLDPFEVLKKRAEDIETMRSVFGTGKEGGRFVDSVEDLLKLKKLLGADEDTKTLLAGIYKYITEAGAGKGESEEVTALREGLKSLTEELQKKDREAIASELSGLRTKLSEVMGEIQRVKQGERATNEYGIMSEMVKVVDRRLSAMENTVQGVFGKRPPPLAEAEKKKITEAISEEAQAEAELDELAEQAFYTHS